MFLLQRNFPGLFETSINLPPMNDFFLKTRPADGMHDTVGSPRALSAGEDNAVISLLATSGLDTQGPTNPVLLMGCLDRNARGSSYRGRPLSHRVARDPRPSSECLLLR